MDLLICLLPFCCKLIFQFSKPFLQDVDTLLHYTQAIRCRSMTVSLHDLIAKKTRQNQKDNGRDDREDDARSNDNQPGPLLIRLLVGHTPISFWGSRRYAAQMNVSSIVSRTFLLFVRGLDRTVHVVHDFICPFATI